ncbi:ubiquinol-cytochrome C reductase complex subunit UcrQ [Penicillium odoratum]|uniref:ubiquinol-cytochrome C reductase complex subunit UcrQ n=1 Tax=Penicillium odoratum TaxID=1167516 RepID=UPI002546B806|nr:ubiquinol-cytochrome C reductase complex subunit UcrQ [Penicillium odoratum]KAJ5752651.1 ubiquinol-cytochrome C reductase complex subunit UcrQ [Penicillium odoratum]
MGGHADAKTGHYIGTWGKFGCPTPQRIATYSLSPNRQRPFAGAFNAAIFNTFRRFRNQVLYVVPPFVVAYAAMNWAVERNEYLNSKPGRLLEGGGDEE